MSLPCTGPQIAIECNTSTDPCVLKHHLIDKQDILFYISNDGKPLAENQSLVYIKGCGGGYGQPSPHWIQTCPGSCSCCGESINHVSHFTLFSTLLPHHHIGRDGATWVHVNQQYGHHMHLKMEGGKPCKHRCPCKLYIHGGADIMHSPFHDLVLCTSKNHDAYTGGRCILVSGQIQRRCKSWKQFP